MQEEEEASTEASTLPVIYGKVYTIKKALTICQSFLYAIEETFMQNRFRR